MTKIKGLIQAGHVAPREPGFESGTGTRREAELALAIQSSLANLFRADGRFDITTTPGDIPENWVGDFAYFLHADGSVDPLSSGMSFGYQNGGSARLAQIVRRNFNAIAHPGVERSDNYTRNLSGYYGFSHTSADVEVLVEHGFLTNPSEAAWLFANVDRLAKAEYEAVLEYYDLPPARWLFGYRVNRVLTREQVQLRNRVTVRRTTPTGQVTTWQGWRSDGHGANGPLRVLALVPDTLDFRSKFDIAWQGHWFLQDELGTQGIVNVAKSIYSRFS